MIKKVAFIGPLPTPLGGVAVMNQSFQNIDYDGYVVASLDTAEKKEREDLYAKFKIKSIQRNLQVSRRLEVFIKKEEPDIINIFITSGMSILRDILFLKKINKYTIPVIIHFHSKTQGEFALTPKRLKLVAKYFNKYASAIILLSEYHYNYFVKYFGEEKCTVVENFVNYKDFENEISNKNNEFLFVGRLSKEKGFFDLLEAVRILKEKDVFCRIQVVGVAPTEEIESKIKQLISNYGLSDYFVFNGALFGERKNNLYKKSCCLLFPSHFENSPVVLKEAIPAKMAILSSNIEANINVLQERGNHILFEKGNISMLSEKLISLINNRQKVLDMCFISESINEYDVAIAKEKMTLLFNKLTNDEK